MRIGFTGTGSPPGMLRPRVESLVRLLRELGAEEFHHGDCVWSDAQAHRVAVRLNVRVVVHPPTNPRLRAWCDPGSEGLILSPEEYLVRNRAIVDSTQILLAAPLEQTGERVRSGTWSTVRYARQVLRPVYVIRPDGHVELSPSPILE